MTHWTEDAFVENHEVFERSMRKRVENAPEEVDQLLTLLEDHGVDPDTALDVACGLGRHSLELARAGLSVRGVDLSPEYVETARERAVEADLGDRATFEVGDMRDLGEYDGEYDLVTNLWTSFGFFDEETNEAVAAGLRERTAPGGVLAMELVNKEYMLSNFRGSSAAWEEDGLYVELTDYDPAAGRVQTDLLAFRDQDDDYEYVGDVSWDLRVYGPAELRRLLERVGYSSVHLYGGLDGSSLDRESSRLVVVAEA